MREAQIQEMSSVAGSDMRDMTPTVGLDLDALQDTQDEVERLQDLLEKREHDLEEARKRVADVTENLQIAEERTEHASNERETFADKSREYIMRIEKMADEIKDQQIQLEDCEMKMQR